jgi:hypothetical protein
MDALEPSTEIEKETDLIMGKGKPVVEIGAAKVSTHSMIA